MENYKVVLFRGLSLLVAIFGFTRVQLFSQETVKVQSGAVVTVQSDAQLVIQGGMALENGSTLSNNGTIILKQSGVSGAADWIDNTVTRYNYGTGKVVFNSTGGHLVNSKNIFQRIDVDAPGHVNLGSDVVANKWYLINGRINTSSYKAIALSNTQLSVEADGSNTNFSNSWINGTLRRYIVSTVVNNYIFPVGDAKKVNTVVLDNLTADPLNNLLYVDASFGPKAGNDIGLIATENGQSYISVNSGGVWHITPDVQPTLGKYDAMLYFNGFTGLEDNLFAILKRSDLSSKAFDWISSPGSSLPASNQSGRILSAGYARRNRISSFGQFGIGQFSTALPVTLLNFDANRLTRMKVEVKWQTITESNNAGFDIERRLEGESEFTKIDFTVTRALGGNSSKTLSYNFTDANDFSGVSYYRLKQIDNEGRFTYTHIEAVKGIGEIQVSVLLYPNPNYGQFIVRLDGVTKAYDALIMDETGKVVKQLKLVNTNNVSVSGLSAGTYIIRIPDVFGPGESFSEKVMVIR